jgi:cytochrome c-type biogenesis protein
VFIALGAAATGFSGLLRRWSGEAALIGGAMVFVFGLMQAGLFRLPALLLRDLRPALHQSSLVGGTPVEALLVGAAFAFGWTPCIGPVLGAVLSASAAGLGNGVALLAAYSAGLGVPFLLAAFYLPILLDQARRKGLTRLGTWLQRGSGVVVSVMGLALMTGELTTIAGWLMQTFPVLARIG